jgi:multidrug efflux pump subunit AcrA (membrane-fusion protein)
MSLRAALEARAQLARAQVALESGDLSRAVAHLRLSARWDAPGNVYAQRALANLEQLASAAELRGETALALGAYRAVHAALHASRGINIRDPELLARADARIAALMARQAGAQKDAALSLAQRERRYRELLQLKAPRAFGVLLACSGFFCWVLAFAALVLRGLDDEGRIVKAVARPSFLCLVFGWVAFAVGLHIA